MTIMEVENEHMVRCENVARVLCVVCDGDVDWL